MDVKNIYDKVKDFSLKASIEIPKYLFGHDIHVSNVKRRQDIRDNEDNLGLRVLKLSLNYGREGIREAVRYAPLVMESLFLYEYATHEKPLYATLIASESIRLIEANSMIGQRSSQTLDELNRVILDINKTFQDLGDVFKRLQEEINNNPRFRALWKGKLLLDPYSVLGINDTANKDEVKKAFREIAMEFHPDHNFGGDDEKIERFIEATKAYNQINKLYHKL